MLWHGMKMADLVSRDYSLSGVLERMGMSYGFGDETVSDVCSRAGISAAIFILICNVYLSEGYTPTREVLEQIDLRDVLRYLRLSHTYYEGCAVKSLSQALDVLMAPCGETHKMIIARFFSDYTQELSKHFEYEETVDGCLDILSKPEEYLFYDVFPTARLAATNADEKTIHLEKKKRFATITCRSIDGALTGSTEATPDGVMYIDDMVSDELEANSAPRLDSLWDKVRGDLLGRRLEGCPIVAQGTRYSLRDPLGRLQEIAPVMGWRTRVLEIPALDPVTDESNFAIMLHGKPAFTTEYYRHERELVTPVQWASQFQQEPYEARGLLFPKDELN